jgi:hypothetical protein
MSACQEYLPVDDRPTTSISQMRTHKNERALESTFARWPFVGAILMLFVLATVGVAQACQFESNLSPPMARSAAQIGTQRSAIGSAVTTSAVLNTSVGSLGAGHCNGLCCAGTCGAACSAGMIVECSIPSSSTLQSISTTFVHTPLPLTKSDAPFRPPRLFI